MQPYQPQAVAVALPAYVLQGLHLSTSRNAPDVARLFSGRRSAADPDDRLPPAGTPQAFGHQRKGQCHL